MSLTPALLKFLCSSAVSDPLGFTVCFLRRGGPAISGTARPVGRTCARRAGTRRVRWGRGRPDAETGGARPVRPVAPVARGGRSRSCDRAGERAGPGRAVGRDRGPPGACELVAQPRCNGGRSKAAPCPRGARDNPAPLCAVARSPRN